MKTSDSAQNPGIDTSHDLPGSTSLTNSAPSAWKQHDSEATNHPETCLLGGMLSTVE